MTDFDLKNLFETAQKVQEEMNRVKESLGRTTVEGESGGGLVRCVANGKGEVVSIDIDAAIIVASEKKMMEDLITGAVNVALDKARDLAQSQLAKATGGLSLPPGFAGL